MADLNMAAAELAGWDQGADHRKGSEAPKRGEGERPVTSKGPSARVHVATVSNDKASPDRAPENASLPN